MEQLTKTNIETISKMNDSALLAFILSSGGTKYCSLEKTAEILRICDNNLNKLYTTSVNDLVSKGLSLSDSMRVKAAFELGQRRLVSEILGKPKITSSRDIYSLFQHLSDYPYEEFWIVVLNKANRVTDRILISEGGISGTVVDPKKIFKLALEAYACALILVHNHPSGNIQPSEPDIAITKKITEAGKMLDIAVLDHIIIGFGYYSFADEGNL